jgi:hypothetical protein
VASLKSLRPAFVISRWWKISTRRILSGTLFFSTVEKQIEVTWKIFYLSSSNHDDLPQMWRKDRGSIWLVLEMRAAGWRGCISPN